MSVDMCAVCDHPEWVHETFESNHPFIPPQQASAGRAVGTDDAPSF